MKNEIKRAKELTASRWAGGTTTQLFIYPPGTEYQKFNFVFRMSFATVEIAETTFTFMPGVTRHLMILDGKLHIDHTGRYTKQLSPFDQDVFNGEWHTTAKGTVKDFNLMTREGAEGKLIAVKIQSDSYSYNPQSVLNYNGFYVQSGSVEINILDEKIKLGTGDFLLCDYEKQAASEISIHSDTDAAVVIAEVTLK